jgi:hypothetical protein
MTDANAQCSAAHAAAKSWWEEHKPHIPYDETTEKYVLTELELYGLVLSAHWEGVQWLHRNLLK